MSRKSGIQLTCDGCGTEVFLRFMFSPKPNDPESPPEGWMTFPELGELCPTCAKAMCVNITRIFGDNTPEQFKRYM